MNDFSNPENEVKFVEFNLKISASEYLKYYQGVASVVKAVSIDGRRVAFPANLLSKYVTHDGISGQFVLFYRSNGKAIKLERKV